MQEWSLGKQLLPRKLWLCQLRSGMCPTLLNCSALPASPHSHLNPKWVQEQSQSTLLDLGEREKDFLFSFPTMKNPAGKVWAIATQINLEVIL